MKGPVGLIIAAALGLFGAILNWYYLQQKAGDFETESFLGLKAGAEVKPGEILQDKHFAEVRIPGQHAGDLKDFVYLYKDRSTVVGIRATRAYQGGDLVFRRDYRTPPPELKLAADERLVWIPVDSRSFVPDLVDPGDQITFILPRGVGGGPTPALGGGARGPAANRSAGPEMIGPFRIGSLGSRLGSSDVTTGRASHGQQVGIVVKVEGESLEQKALTLLRRLQETNYQNVGVVLHPRIEES